MGVGFNRRGGLRCNLVLVGMIVGSRCVLVHGDEPRARFSDDGVWEHLEAVPQRAVAPEPWIQPDVYKPVLLDSLALSNLLAAAPMEFTPAARQAPLVVTLPMPDGGFAQFLVEEAPIMEPALAAQFPEIKTYRGQGIDDPSASLRFDVTPQGFHAQILSPNGAVYIDPFWRGDTSVYACYYKKDYRAGARPFTCLVDGQPAVHQPLVETASVGSTQLLRKYRLACAATGEYTQFHQGTVASGLAAIVVAVNRVSGIYETEVAASLTLVGNNNLIVYTNGASDPYSNLDGFAMLNQNQTNLTNVIGSANYDVGHVFSTGGGGVAGLEVVCKNSSKARGVTGLGQPVGDPFYVDYVAHEMGHQFGGNHSFNGVNGSCAAGNRNGSTAYEPGSGSTVMAYAGICGSDDLQPNSDPFFHFISVQEIRAYITSDFGNTCPLTVDSGNMPPVVEAGSNFNIPSRTPFKLTASGSDPDGHPVTYCWEERDLGAALALSAPDNGTSPLFRSFNPSGNEFRYFPRLSNILNGTASLGERLPTTTRLVRYRVTARDNRSEGGGVAFDDMQLSVTSVGSAFQVTQPASGVTWFGGRTVTWNLANTASPPISTALVNILLSTDGGQTFPTVLAANVPNDGSEVVTLPDLAISTARIKVEPVGNVYFAISPGNFTITACGQTAPPLAEISPVVRNRYLSFRPNNGGVTTGYRVTLVDLPPPFEAFEGETRWLGPAQLAPTGGSTFWASSLQCEPFFSNWTGATVLNAYSSAVIPGAVYEVQATQCVDLQEEDFSDPMTIVMAKWGDVVDPFEPPALSQPNFADVSAIVDSFRVIGGAIDKTRAQLQPDAANPFANISFADISECVEAFRGGLYPYAGPTGCQ